MGIKVCMLCPFYPNEREIAEAHIGGVERHVQLLSRELVKLNVEVKVITSYNENIVEFDEGTEIVRLKRKFIAFRNPFFPWKKYITDEFELLHTHGTYPLMSDISAKVAKKYHIPSILTYHRDGDASGVLGKMFTKVYYLTLARSMSLHSKIIATTRSYARSSKFLSKIPENRLEIIPNGVDINKFNLKGINIEVLNKYGLDEGYVLFVGRLVPYKGLDYLVKAVKYIDNDVVIVGSGPLEKKLQTIPNIRLLGHVEDDELPDLYRGAAVSVLPSINPSEAFGITLIESMACGTPVVGSDLEGVKEIAQLGGVVVRRKDVESLGRGIKEVIDKKLDKKHLHELVSKRFSWKSIAGNVKQIYISLLEGHS